MVIQTRHARRACALALAGAVVVAMPAASRAQSQPPSPAADSPTDPKKEQAKQHYLRALELYQDAVYDAACLEFQKAYDLAPTYKLFYNLAVCSQRLNDFAEAYRFYTRYLHDGGTDVPRERVDFVNKQLEMLAVRVSRVVIHVNVAGAEVSVDDAPVGTSPIAEPLLVNSGKRRITVSARGWMPTSRVVAAAGGDTLTVEVQLTQPGAQHPEAKPDRPAVGASRPVVWPYWGVAALLGAGAAGYTVVAFSSKSHMDSTVNRLGASNDDIRAAESSARRDALIADVLWGTTAVAAGVAVFATIRSRTGEKKTVGLSLGPGSAAVRGKF